jgi:hemerythrin-like domain-containing protein
MNVGPIEMLLAEHRNIEKVIDAILVVKSNLVSGEAVEPQTLRDMVEFMRLYADKCHHGKEEAILFPLLVEKGVPAQGGPIQVLTHEHELCRKAVGEFATVVEAYAKSSNESTEELISKLCALTALYPNHIWKEDNVLFPMSEEIFDVTEKGELLKSFEKVDQEQGEATHKRLVAIAEDLSHLTNT